MSLHTMSLSFFFHFFLFLFKLKTSSQLVHWFPLFRALSLRSLVLLSVVLIPPFTMLPNYPVDLSHISGLVVRVHNVKRPLSLPESSFHRAAQPSSGCRIDRAKKSCRQCRFTADAVSFTRVRSAKKRSSTVECDGKSSGQIRIMRTSESVTQWSPTAHDGIPDADSGILIIDKCVSI